MSCCERQFEFRAVLAHFLAVAFLKTTFCVLWILIISSVRPPVSCGYNNLFFKKNKHIKDIRSWLLCLITQLDSCYRSSSLRAALLYTDTQIHAHACTHTHTHTHTPTHARPSYIPCMDTWLANHQPISFCWSNKHWLLITAPPSLPPQHTHTHTHTHTPAPSCSTSP